MSSQRHGDQVVIRSWSTGSSFSLDSPSTSVFFAIPCYIFEKSVEMYVEAFHKPLMQHQEPPADFQLLFLTPLNINPPSSILSLHQLHCFPSITLHSIEQRRRVKSTDNEENHQKENIRKLLEVFYQEHIHHLHSSPKVCSRGHYSTTERCL